MMAQIIAPLVLVLLLASQADGRGLYNSLRGEQKDWKTLLASSGSAPLSDPISYCPALTRLTSSSIQQVLGTASAQANLLAAPIETRVKMLNERLQKAIGPFSRTVADLAMPVDDAEKLRVKERLLGSIGWERPDAPEDLVRLVRTEARVREPLRPLLCRHEPSSTGSCSSLNNLAESDLNENLITSAREKVLEDLSEGMTVDEMIRSRLIPSTQAQARLFFALAAELKLPITPAIGCIVADGHAKKAFLGLMLTKKGYVVVDPNASPENAVARVDSRPTPGQALSVGPVRYNVTQVYGEIGSPAGVRHLCFTSKFQLDRFACDSFSEGN